MKLLTQQTPSGREQLSSDIYNALKFIAELVAIAAHAKEIERIKGEIFVDTILTN